MCYPIRWWQASQDIHIIFLTSFLTKYHTMENLHMNFVSLCIYLAFKFTTCNLTTLGGGALPFSRYKSFLTSNSATQSKSNYQTILWVQHWKWMLHLGLRKFSSEYILKNSKLAQLLLCTQFFTSANYTRVTEVTMDIYIYIHRTPTTSGIFCSTPHIPIPFLLCTHPNGIIPGWTTRL